MSIALVTGSAGLIGSETVKFFSEKGMYVIGIDNDMRKFFFGEEASTAWNRRYLEKNIKDYKHYHTDIRDIDALELIYKEYGNNIDLIVHTAAQPSHDWAAKDPFVDYHVNTTGTLNLLEMTRKYCPEACFIFTSTNKVYGDTPNRLPLVELATRWEIETSHKYYKNGIDESMSIDNSLHSLFGASKTAADVIVQEYGKYFGMKTGVFRGGCLTGSNHSGTQLHGFLSYLVRCALSNTVYTVFGYKGKQVRDNIHSFDLVNMFWHFYNDPRPGEVYNAGGSRFSNCSVLEAITRCEEITKRKMKVEYSEQNRTGDHIWWISDTNKFSSHYPDWSYRYSLNHIIDELFSGWHIRGTN